MKIKIFPFRQNLFFLLIQFSFLFSSIFSFSQPSIQSLEERLTFEVKNVEDFIDRFNFIDGNYFLKYYREKYPDQKLTRAETIKSLFAFVNGKCPFGIDTINAFINQIVEPSKPNWLNFYYPGWYAVVDCKFDRQGKMENVKLSLEIESDTGFASKWVISGVQSKFTYISPQRNMSKFLSPVSYGTDFMGLDKILNDKKNLVSYMNSNFKPSSLSIFISELKSEKLKFIQVNSVSYYFFQIPNWGFKVKYYPDPSPLPGWLISDLFLINDGEKEFYVYKNLGVQ